MFLSRPKIDYGSFDLDGFNYRDFAKINPIMSLLRKIAGTEGNISPVTLPKARSIFPWKPRNQSLFKTLGEAIGFDDPIYANLLSYHQNQLDKQYSIGFVIYMMTLIPLVFAPLFFAISIISTNASPFSTSLLWIVIFLFSFVIFAISIRFSDFVILKYFSTSLSIQTLFFIIIELARCTSPMTPSQKKQLLLRTEFLIKATHTFFNQYDLNATTSNWVKNHFRNIASFIEEREKWILAPKDSTLADLQQDFHNLASMYLSGNFGYFEYENVNMLADVSSNTLKEFLIGMPRIAVGILLPLLGLLISSLRPDLIANVVDVKVFALICLGWLLLAIDVILKLGIVSSVIGIAKGIKDLG